MMPDPMLAGFSGDSLTRKQLLAGEGNYLAKVVTLLNGQNVVRGTVLGQITSGGKYKLSAVGAGDGSEPPAVIVVHDAFADGADAECLVYYADGVFNWEFMIVGASHTLDTVRAALLPHAMHVVTSESASDPS